MDKTNKEIGYHKTEKGDTFGITLFLSDLECITLLYCLKTQV